MAHYNESDNLESRIIETARLMFIENGFEQTSMSDIAARVGINRPVLHYYFRTKEKMYRAVFSSIVSTLFPKIQDIILKQDRPIAERLGMVVDAYYGIFRENPHLPLFVIREMQRDFDFLSNTIRTLHLDVYLETIKLGLQEEMDCGRLREVPLIFVFYTFYGLLTTPFLVRRLTEAALLCDKDSFDEILLRWKPYIVGQMENLLRTDRQAS